MAEAKKLVVTVTCCNVKKLDLKAYNVTKQRSYVVVKVGDKEVQTSVGEGLDPTWEETFEFDITDEKNTPCSASFFMGEPAKQIGDTQAYLVDKLVINKPTYKAIIVPGGKVEMMFTAKGFGEEDKPVDTSDFMDLMGDDGAMVMDDDE